MRIPSSIVKALKKTPFDNTYFYMHQDMKKSLDKVISGEDSYASYHYSMLINDLEIYLKGFLTYQKESGFWVEPHNKYLTEDHKIYKLIEQVQLFIPLFPYTSKYEWNELKRFTSNLCREYTTARYLTPIPFEDFVELNNNFVQPIITKINDFLKEKEASQDFDFEIGL